MPQPVKETWNWPKISKRTVAAAVVAVNQATSQTKNEAAPRVNVRTGALKRSVDTVEAQLDRRGDVVGYVGYLDDLPYALIQEILNPALRPAADANAPQIPAIMKKELARTQRNA